MSLEFRPTIKGINITSSDTQKVTLEITNGSLAGKIEELNQYVGKTVTLAVVPETYTYKIPYEKESNTPQELYVVNGDGTIEFVKEEQTALDIDGQAPDVELRDFIVDKDVCDAFIKNAKSLEFPGNINPRAVLLELEDGEPLSEIAERNEMSETAVMKELDRAHEYYAPYADAWNRKRSEVVFAEEVTEKADAEPEESENEPETEEKIIEAAEDETPEKENSDDPY
ncbi:MAG: hypothetical protein ACTH54_03220 [Vagococcus salmoninarum]|uniref:hypothetical protein n=1 Tax=Vagococcus salmoninarum TaxID=2739 RepID=UPI003F94B953